MEKRFKNKPAYQIIYDYFKEKITNREYGAGYPLPSEKELERIFNVSRTPVRQALKQLKNDQYIYSVQGRGSFVSNLQPRESWTLLMSGFKNQYNTEWRKMSVRTIELKKITSPYFSNLLNIDKNEEIIYMKRVRYLYDKPILYMEHYTKPVIPIEKYQQNNKFSSVHQMLKEECNLELIEAEDKIEAVISDPYIAGILQIPTNSPVLKGTRISYAASKEPIDINIFYIKTEEWKYHAQYRY